MPTTMEDYNLHDHAGARWLAPFLTVFLLAVVGILVMVVYPYLTR